ncbi:MAG: hypothetical protein ABL901_05305 [Hyphomicrobiaceae bacterium]
MESFEFSSYEIDAQSGRVQLKYAFNEGPSFVETIDFNHPLPSNDSPYAEDFNLCIRALWRMAGVSYYKAFAPAIITSPVVPFDDRERVFFQTVYRGGLAEFGYRNGLDIIERVNFFREPDSLIKTGAHSVRPNVKERRSMPRGDTKLPRRSAVLIGGGKDSIVSIELLRSIGEPIVLFAVNPKGPISACIESSGLPSITVQRQLDPGLFELNDAGALNGHVPITGLISWIALAGAFVYGYDAVILSNERSANEGNININDRSVNHQYSKSLDFENDMRSYLAGYLSTQVDYFSLLRPLSEIHIAKLLSKSERYDSSFSSCNRAFKIRSSQSAPRWCGDCPKCRFTYLSLATAISRERLNQIFRCHLLDEPTQIQGFKELVGLANHKPWECVGEIAESAAAIMHLAADPAWANSVVIKELAPEIAARRPFTLWPELFTLSTDHNLAPKYLQGLNANVE